MGPKKKNIAYMYTARWSSWSIYEVTNYEDCKIKRQHVSILPRTGPRPASSMPTQHGSDNVISGKTDFTVKFCELSSYDSRSMLNFIEIDCISRPGAKREVEAPRVKAEADLPNCHEQFTEKTENLSTGWPEVLNARDFHFWWLSEHDSERSSRLNVWNLFVKGG